MKAFFCRAEASETQYFCPCFPDLSNILPRRQGVDPENQPFSACFKSFYDPLPPFKIEDRSNLFSKNEQFTDNLIKQKWQSDIFCKNNLFIFLHRFTFQYFKKKKYLP